MSDQKRTTSTVLMHAVFGALLAVVILFGVQSFYHPFAPIFFVLSALGGFLMGALWGDRAIEFLKEIFIWS